MNPELARNLWLEAPRGRLVGAGVILALIYGVTLVVARSADAAETVHALGQTGTVIFFACGVIWGGWAAGGSVLAEIRGRTWEFQRLSALEPWAMTWGKLFGATSLAWLGALTGLVAAGAAEAGDQGPVAAFLLVAGLLGLAVFVQACAMGAALIGVRKARAEGRVATGGAVVLGVIGGLILLSMVSSSLGLRGGPHASIAALFSQQPPVTWWGEAMPALAFTSLSLCAFAAWAVVGAWRLMRLELQMRNTPWIWTGFLIFAALWRAGLATPMEGAAGWAFAGAATLMVATYVSAFAEPADAIRLRRFVSALRSGALLPAADLAPASLFALKLAGLAVVAFCLLPQGFGDPSPLPGPVGALAVLAFVIRDMGVIALVRFGPRPGRGDLTAVIALALLYGVGAAVGFSTDRAVGAALFVPLASAMPTLSLVSGVVQAAVAWGLAAQRLRGPRAV